MSYYYFMASLPLLAIGNAPGISPDDFLEQGRAQLRTADQEAVMSVFDDARDCSHPVVRAWRERETQLRNELVKIRADKRQQDAAPFLREHSGFETTIETGVGEAFGAATPLDREHALDVLRWQLIDELASTEEFTSAAVVAYALKLKIAARWAAMDEAAGETRADALINMSPAAAGGNGTDEQAR